MSAASVRLVPAAAGGRPPHRVHQVQEAGHRAPGLQRRAGEGPQVSSLPYHTIYTIPYHTPMVCKSGAGEGPQVSNILYQILASGSNQYLDVASSSKWC